MSPVAIALWSIALKPSKEPLSFIPQSDLRITNIALGDELADASGRTSVKLTYQTPIKLDDEDEDDEESAEPISTTVLGSLTPGKIEQATVDLVLEEDEEYLFEIVGKNTIFLTGNYIDQVPPDNVPYNGDSEDDMDEEAYDLRDVSSDVEVNPDEVEFDSDADDADRFEEIDDKVDEKGASASLKRPRDSDAMDTESLSKSAQKKLNKKLKAEGGKAIAAGSGDEEKKSKKEKKEKAKHKKDESEEAKTGVEGGEKTKKGDAKLLEGGIKVVDAKPGTGVQAKKGNTVSMRYIGKLASGKIFDQNVKGKPFTFRLGRGEVIKGWDIGVAGMQVGGERLLTIPAAMAYGNKVNGDIPPNSTLTFEAKLLGIK
ncbi:hypothetical protein PILCRDRAFT_111087 [Piloderma croceum F 1598]|uniref:FK506-binding protein n=1 Tax=Piloderma croceum (strain F 1598) TaxID=765440 RepID=A0A0C3G758_PILCF|nr:hypothetical protein PILCRDRAFT_111087 [Piloderma croceum F 1598]